MKRYRIDCKQLKLFAVLAGLGLLAQFDHVHIPHTDVLIDGRWAFGFMGFALLRRWWTALLLAVCLSTPWGSDVPFGVGLAGNLAYAIPSLLLIRMLHGPLLRRLGASWGYGLAWTALVLLCYQAFTTPVVWGVLGVLEGAPVAAKVMEGWRTQPFLVESILVAVFSATAMVAYLSNAKLRSQQRRLEHVNRLLLGIRNVNQLIIAEDDPHRLIQRACVNLTETVGYLNAWIALLDESGHVADLAASGFDDEVGLLRSRLDEGRPPDCMRRAIQRHQTVVVADPPAHCRDCPVAESYAGRAGFCHRLHHGDKTYGVLAVSVPVAYATDEQEQSLFEEVAGDLAFALHKIEAARALQESRIMLERTEAVAHVGSWKWEANGDKVTWSREVFRILGLEPAKEAPPFAEHQSIYVPEDRARLLQAVEQCLKDGLPYDLEVRAMRPNGEVRLCIVRGIPERGPDGAINRLYGSLQDITDIRRAERRISLLGRMLDEAPASITIHDTEGHFVFANAVTASLHGYESVDEFLEMNLHDLDVPESEALLAERFRQIAERGEARFEVAHYRKDGSTFPLEVLAKRIEWEGRPAVLSIATDITDRKQAESALQESETRYRRLFESAKDGILILDADSGEVVDVNPFLTELLGYDYDSLLGKHLWDIGTFRNIAQSREDFRTLQEKEYIRYDDMPLETADGRVVEVEFVSNVYLANHTKVIQCNIRDISQRKALEGQLAQAQKMEAVGRLAGGVAHDFNNMLQTILGYCDMLLAEAGRDHPFRESLEEIRNAGKRSADLTRQLLAFARKQTVSPVVLDINAAVSDTLKMLHRLIGEDIDLLWQPCQDKCLVNIDPAQVDQILANLVVNSRDAIAGNGRITIETNHVEFDEEYCRAHQGFRKGRYEMLAVSDDGAGMDRQTLDQVFEPFFTTKGKEKGTGLGLATVYGIVKQNDGFINIYSEPGQGTTVRVCLPAVMDGRESPRRKATDGDLPTGTETVLLVEDEPALLKLSRQVLEGLGYRVLAASCPQEALNMAADRGCEFDVLITDVVMPHMSGRELQKQLSEHCPGLRCLFMSGYTENVIAHHGVLEEGVHFLQKPFSTADLARKLREVLEDTKGQV